MKPRRAIKPQEELEMDPVEVFARIKTVSTVQELCVDYVDETTIKCIPPPSVVSDKGMQASFTRVFDQGSTQNDVFDKIARPMVQKLLDGRSGLLFNYGVTCSGKTYTMTGSPKAPGFLPRALEMIFSSIDGKATKEFEVQADDKNGFKLLSEPEIMAHRLEKRNDLVSSRLMRNRTEQSVEYDIDEHYMLDLQDGIKYAIFMSYIDIYNEHIYDLLADVEKRAKPVALRIRDNVDRGVYAHGVTLKEVRSLDDAFRTYEKGLKQRRNAETSLNLTSSRSHAILTLHVVRVPFDKRTNEVFTDQDIDLTPNSSSLHLVDLAGSERQSRTNAHGDRLKEAGSINNSLMTLRRCIDILRQNQKSGLRGNVPYRSSKLTHLFRNFFEVIGGVKLVICVNPGAAEFEENLNVLNFAEAAQNIQCKREELKIDFDVDRMMAKSAEAADDRDKKNRRRTILEAWKVNEDALNTGPTLPCLEMFNIDDEEMLSNVIIALRSRIERREVIEEETCRMTTTFRKKLNHYERENIDAVSKLRIIEPQLEKHESELKRLKKDNERLEKKNRVLMETERVYKKEMKNTECDLQTVTNQLHQTSAAKSRIQQDAQQKISDHKRKLESETNTKIQQTTEEARRKLLLKEEKMNKLKNILASQHVKTPQVSRGRHVPATPTSTRADRVRPSANRRRSVSESRVDDVSSVHSSPHRTPKTQHASASNLRSTNRENRPPSKPQRSTDRSSRQVQQTTDNIALSRRRSRSADGRKWLAHTPNETVHTGTVLQPKVDATKRVHVPNEKDLKLNDRYLLTHQEQSGGNKLKTTLVKGEVFDTRTGGIQVKFTGKERLTTAGVTAEPMIRRGVKRRSEGESEPESMDSEFTDVATRCDLAVVHERGAATAHVTNANNKRRK